MYAFGIFAIHVYTVMGKIIRISLFLQVRSCAATPPRNLSTMSCYVKCVIKFGVSSGLVRT